ncbi:MAG TPA: ankyrin repeat domain-containing protein [Thermoanaerobaculia bacterium]|jgi:ankyrin repeat protein
MTIRMLLLSMLLFQTFAAAGAQPAQSEIMKALFRIEKGFIPPQKNEALQALLAKKPDLTFFEACGVGDAARVRALLEAKPSLVNEWTSFGWTPLHLAAFSGNVETAKLLLDRGAAVNVRAKSKFRNTPLQAAMLTAQYDTTKLLLEHGADALVRQAEGFAPVHEAALLGRLDLLELLLAHGAELDARANDGRTALTEAMRGKHAEMVAYLRGKGAAGAELTADLMKSP